MNFVVKLFVWFSEIRVFCIVWLALSSVTLKPIALGSSVPCGDSGEGILDELNSTCYIFRSEARIWQESELFCQSVGGHLASAKSAAEQTAIRLVLESRRMTDDLWVGGRLERLRPPLSRLWRWISDCVHCGRDTEVTAAVSPQGCYKDSSTVPDLPYNISTIDGSLTPAVCIQACLHQGFWFSGVQSGNRCFCGNDFGEYGQIDSSVDENNCVTSCTGDSSLRCGGPGLNFIYYNLGGYTEWGYGRPNNYGAYQTCALLSQKIQYKFDDDDCGKTTGDYICDIPAAKCSNGSILVNESCFYISNNESVTWFEARNRCLLRGGDLVKVNSQSELNFWRNHEYIKALRYWTGLISLVWSWTNGDDLTYSNWFSVGNDPTDWEPNEIGNQCLLVSPQRNFQWIDGNCNLPRPYLCQKSIVATTTLMEFTTNSDPMTTSHSVVSSTRPSISNDPSNLTHIPDTVTTTNPNVSSAILSSNDKSSNFTWSPERSVYSSSQMNRSASDSSTQQRDSEVTAQAAESISYDSLSNVELALIILCAVFVIILIVTLIVVFCCCVVNRKNKVDGDQIYDSTNNPSKSENSLRNGSHQPSQNGNSEKIVEPNRKLIIN